MTFYHPMGSGEPPMLQTADPAKPLCALVPLDGSPEAERALEPAAQFISTLVSPDHGEFHLLHVVRREDASPATGEHEAQETSRAEAEHYLHAVAERRIQESQAGAPLEITWSVVFDPDGGAILDEGTLVERQIAWSRYVAIVLSSHSQSGVQLWALGSVTDRVLQTSALPVLLVRTSHATIALPMGVDEEQETGAEISTWPGYESLWSCKRTLGENSIPFPAAQTRKRRDSCAVLPGGADEARTDTGDSPRGQPSLEAGPGGVERHYERSAGKWMVGHCPPGVRLAVHGDEGGGRYAHLCRPA